MNRPNLLFGGPITTAAARQTLLSRKEFADKLAAEEKTGGPDASFVGEAPETALKISGLSALEFMQEMDSLARYLKRHPGVIPDRTMDIESGVTRLKNLQVRYLGVGTYAHSYAVILSAPDKTPFTMKLKCFKGNPGNYQDHGPYKEPANGLWLNARGVSDVVQFYCAKPSGDWLLQEYLDAEIRHAPRFGPTYQSLQLHFTDEASNDFDGLRYDFGGMRVGYRAHVAKPLYFGGPITTRRAANQLLSEATVKKLLAKEPENPYMGYIPETLQQAMGLSEAEVCQWLDAQGKRMHTVLTTKNLDQRLFVAPLPKPITDAKGNTIKTVAFTRVGDGSFGAVFRVKIGDEKYALKIFSEETYSGIPETEDDRFISSLHGPYKEAANGIYLNSKQVEGIVPFYMANPLIGWQLTAFIEEDQTNMEPGAPQKNKTPKNDRDAEVSLSDLRLRFYDEGDNNYVDDVRVDLGGLGRSKEVRRALDIYAKQQQSFCPSQSVVLSRNPEHFKPDLSPQEHFPYPANPHPSE
ncbi:MAG: hypothetical protein K2X01_06640 [Cyanobacteria bacterium]|nr:hypothetical protein [Cyanobacteriota bacterium]